jgi:hypothetical protein
MARPTWNPTDEIREIGEEEFLQYCRDDANRLYEMIVLFNSEYRNRIQQLDDNLTAASDEIAQLKYRIRDKDIAILDLTEERDCFRDAFAQQALQNQNNPGAAPRKSTKIPDPPILTNGKNPTFEDWLSRMEDKLAANADRYQTPALRLAYVKSRCGGRASTHIISRSRSNVMKQYQDAPDIFDHLKTIFLDANRVLNAKRRYRCLFMKASDKSQDFLSEFLYLAQEANLAESEWKEELYYKLHPEIQRLLIKESNDSTLDFTGFVTAYTQTASRLEAINFEEQRLRNFPRSTGFSPREPANQANIETRTAGAITAATSNPLTVSPNGLSNETRIQLMKQGKCFYCREAGHLSYQCPVKKHSIIELKALATVAEQLDTGNSGKEDP